MRKVSRYFIMVLLFLTTASIQASEQDLYKTFFSGKPFPEYPKADLQVRYSGEADLESEDGDFQAHEYNFDSFVNVFNTDTTQVELTLDMTALDINTDARLTRHEESPFPSELYDVGMGAAVRHQFKNDWQLGLNFRVGSASDKLFHSGNETVAKATTFLRIPHGQYNAFIFMLDVRNNNASGAGVVPGIAYQLALGETTWAILGVPLIALHGEPIENLELDAHFLMMRTIHVKACYTLRENLSVCTRFDWDHHTFYRADRKDEEDGLFLYEKRASLGLAYEFTENIKLDLEGGYSFERLIFEGEDYDQRDQNRIDVGGAAFGKASLSMVF